MKSERSHVFGAISESEQVRLATDMSMLSNIASQLFEASKNGRCSAVLQFLQNDFFGRFDRSIPLTTYSGSVPY